MDNIYWYNHQTQLIFYYTSLQDVFTSSLGQHVLVFLCTEQCKTQRGPIAYYDNYVAYRIF